MTNYEKKVKELIVNDNVLEALDLFYNEEARTEIINEVIILKSNLISLNKKIRAGILSYDEEIRTHNKIKYDLLNLIAKAKEVGMVDTRESNTFSFDNADLDSTIERLTSDQFKVLNFINKMNKVRISGCAGSGKTLVAAEKAIRLSKKGLSVIIICHNPNLSSKIKSLVYGTNVFVTSFGQFIQNLNEYEVLQQREWNKYHEPLQEELNNALEIIEKKNIRFDAVIVDEAQDFREDWWLVVEAILAEAKEEILYIFHDDNQALLPHRSVYPIEEPIVDLSKNCRNGGKIYEFIKANFHHQAPETSIEIKDLGRVKLFVYPNRTKIKRKVFSAIDWMMHKKNVTQPLILLAGDINISNWEFGVVNHAIPIGASWKEEIIRKFQLLVPDIDITNKLRHLTGTDLPSEGDVKLIADIANEELEHIDKNYIFFKLGTQIANSNPVNWVEKNDKATLVFSLEDPFVNRYFLLKYLSNPDWDKQLKKELSFNFSDKIIESNDYIPVFETSSFKGLEAEGVILVTKGQSFSHLNELYVASSRAKKILAIVVDKANENFYIP
ncbi:MAG: hypothetical protein DHS20C18_37920 [Saprospiraceae bacterium]|nr:MAG: hypothetical protein DHS20C18_37920 [Saprospiraceae bacterium]